MDRPSTDLAVPESGENGETLLFGLRSRLNIFILMVGFSVSLHAISQSVVRSYCCRPFSVNDVVELNTRAGKVREISGLLRIAVKRVEEMNARRALIEDPWELKNQEWEGNVVLDELWGLEEDFVRSRSEAYQFWEGMVEGLDPEKMEAMERKNRSDSSIHVKVVGQPMGGE